LRISVLASDVSKSSSFRDWLKTHLQMRLSVHRIHSLDLGIVVTHYRKTI